MTTATTTSICTGCGKPLGAIEALYWEVCLDCTKARNRAFTNGGRCVCRSKRPSELHKTGSRSWISCLRCLGTIKQVS